MCDNAKFLVSFPILLRIEWTNTQSYKEKSERTIRQTLAPKEDVCCPLIESMYRRISWALSRSAVVDFFQARE